MPKKETVQDRLTIHKRRRFDARRRFGGSSATDGGLKFVDILQTFRRVLAPLPDLPSNCVVEIACGRRYSGQ